MKVIVLIPARYASTRFPGKPLITLRQQDGSHKTLIHMSWDAACAIRGVADVYVVTDDDSIRDHAEGFGAQVIMTPPECPNGTARCAVAFVEAELDADIVINFQGDAPLTPPWFVEDLIAAMSENLEMPTATPVLQCDAQTYEMFSEDRRNSRVGGTTAVFANDGHALYFSKEIIPYIAPGAVPETDIPVYHHVGVYAYRPEALRAYATWPDTALENLEGLEQLRFLVNGMAMHCVQVDAKGYVFWELNNPEDVARIEKVLEDR